MVVKHLVESIAEEWLRETAASIPSDLAIVELGVFQGGSLSQIALGAATGGAVVVGIDPYGMPGPGERYNRLRGIYGPKNLRIARRATPGATIIQGFSTEVAKTWDGPEVGLLFIDAVHQYESVMEDYAAWEPHLAEGAIVAFDDHDEHRFPGVVRAVGEITRGYYEVIGSRLAVYAPEK